MVEVATASSSNLDTICSPPQQPCMTAQPAQMRSSQGSLRNYSPRDLHNDSSLERPETFNQPRNLMRESLGRYREWQGDTGNKFLPSKLHCPQPVVKRGDNDYHPYYNMKQKKHMSSSPSGEYQFRSSSRQVPGYEMRMSQESRQRGKGHASPDQFNREQIKDNYERRHMPINQVTNYDRTFDNPRQQLHVSGFHNRVSSCSINENYTVENNMTRKGRITNLSAMRAGLSMSSLGDKIYKDVAYSGQFFKEGGLITGSTQNLRKTTGLGKAVDFYTSLQVDQFQPKNKNYNQLTKERMRNDEIGGVKDIRKWERGTLMDHDKTFDADDDSSDEEAIAYKKSLEEKNKPPPKLEPVAKAPPAKKPAAKGKK